MKFESTAEIDFKRSSLLAAKWLTTSGIQNRSTDPRYDGGVYAWFDLDQGTYPFIYSEITGYAVNVYLFFYDLTNDSSFRDCAKKAADWLVRNAVTDSGLLATRYSKGKAGSYFESQVFVFDQWMAVYGLCSAFAVLKEEIYLERAKRMADFLLARTRKSDGTFYPLFDPQRLIPHEPGDKWSRQAGSFLAKSAYGLDELYRLTGDSKYHSAEIELVESILKKQEERGRFITQDSEGSTHLHPFLYTLEGLLLFSVRQRRGDVMACVSKGFKWILETQPIHNGSLYALFNDGKFLLYERADVLAQTLRLGTIWLAYTDTSDEDTDAKLVLKSWLDRLLSYQITSGHERGAFRYGQEENGSVHNHANTWVSMFAAQAIWLYERSMDYNAQRYDFRFFV